MFEEKLGFFYTHHWADETAQKGNKLEHFVGKLVFLVMKILNTSFSLDLFYTGIQGEKNTIKFEEIHE